MRVETAGYNVDKNLLDDINKNNDKLIKILSNCKNKNHFENAILNSRRLALDNERLISNLTPETIAASYARISRDERDIPELRKDAREDIENARKSNDAIIFTMGHKSISEHAVFNFDMMDISRYLIEKIEQMRLVSYTEKSQRYIDMNGKFVMPKELKNQKNSEWAKLALEYMVVVDKQFKFYNDHKDLLTQWHEKNNNHVLEEMNIKSDKKKKETLEGWGKEDARYALPLATEAQVGMTINARNLESLITRMRSSDVLEDCEFGEKLYDLVNGFAPSIIKYLEPTDYFVKTREEIKNYVKDLNFEKIKDSENNLKFFNINDKDLVILASLVFSNSDLSFNECLENLSSLDHSKKLMLDKLAHKYQEKHDVALREYELRSPIEMIVSASNFAQLKRHRMNTLIAQDYNIELGVTIPKSILESGIEDEFNKIINETNKVYSNLKNNEFSSNVANYVLTNSHRRRVLLDANNRQLKAIANERKNLYAQWDIRNICDELIFEMKKNSPITLDFSPGKHEFYQEKERIYGKD